MFQALTIQQISLFVVINSASHAHADLRQNMEASTYLCTSPYYIWYLAQDNTATFFVFTAAERTIGNLDFHIVRSAKEYFHQTTQLPSITC